MQKLESSKTAPGPILASMVKKKLISPLSVYLLNEENLCETFGWTPDQLDNTDPFIIDAFVAILNGKKQGKQ